MSTPHLNYCREMKIKSKETIKNIKDGNPAFKNLKVDQQEELVIDLEAAIGLANTSVKYILPDNGIVLNDKVFSNLPTDSLNLPYSSIALEYRDILNDGSGMIKYNKTIIFAHDKGDVVLLFKIIAVVFGDDALTIGWIPSARFIIDKQQPFKRNRDGHIELAISRLDGTDETDLELDIALGATNVFLSFLNSLAYRGACVSRSSVKRFTSKSGKKKKIRTTIPYDDYNVVTINIPSITYMNIDRGTVINKGTPKRQHTRAGHWRRYKSGKEVYIHDIMINADSDNKVEKVYRLRNRERGVNINTR